MRKLIFTVLIIFSTVLFSCGGGGSSTDTSTAIDNQTQPPDVQTATVNGTVNFIDTAYSSTTTQASITTKDKLLNGGQYIFVVAYSIDENGNPVREDMALVDLNTGQFTLNVPLNKPIALVFNDDTNEYITAVKDANNQITAFSFDGDTTLNLTVYNDLVVTTDIQPNVSDTKLISDLNVDADNDNIPDFNDWDVLAKRHSVEIVFTNRSDSDSQDPYNTQFEKLYFRPTIQNIAGQINPNCANNFSMFNRYRGTIYIYLVKYLTDSNSVLQEETQSEIERISKVFKDTISYINKTFQSNNIPITFAFGGVVNTTTDKNFPINSYFRGIIVQVKDNLIDPSGKVSNITGRTYFISPNPYNNINPFDIYTISVLDTNNNSLTIDRYGFQRMLKKIELDRQSGVEKHTIIHEIGHTLWLEHPFEVGASDIPSVMNYAGDSNYPREYGKFSTDDINLLQFPYTFNGLGVAKNSTEVMNFYANNCDLSGYSWTITKQEE